MRHPVLVVLGAVNVDLVVRGAPLPVPGETVVGGAFERHHGGKGGNQAVAAARALRGGPADGRCGSSKRCATTRWESTRSRRCVPRASTSRTFR